MLLATHVYTFGFAYRSKSWRSFFGNIRVQSRDCPNKLLSLRPIWRHPTRFLEKIDIKVLINHFATLVAKPRSFFNRIPALCSADSCHVVTRLPFTNEPQAQSMAAFANHSASIVSPCETRLDIATFRYKDIAGI